MILYRRREQHRSAGNQELKMEGLQEPRSEELPVGSDQGAYPLEATAASLNRSLGLYLSRGQQQGLAAGLLVGAALAGAIVAWSIADVLMRRSR
jgi:hypothetical protein